MADSAVHALTQKTSLAATDEIYLVQSPYGAGDDRRAVLSDLDAYISATASALTNKTRLSITGGTVTSSTPVLDATQTWNSVGTTFTGLKLNVTDTASASASLLMDLQVGGSSKLKITKAGGIAGPVSNPLTITADSGQNVQVSGATVALVGIVQIFSALWGRSGAASSIYLPSAAQIGFGSSSDNTGTNDTILTRGGAAATLQHGAADAASPVAQTISFQSSTSTNNAGADATIIASRSAGSGASGKIILKGGVTGASSGTTNTSVAALTITSGTTNNTNVGYPSVVIGAGAALATNATDGFLYIPTCAGTPTGTPTTQTGSAPIVLDTSGTKIWLYTGGAWKGVVIA